MERPWHLLVTSSAPRCDTLVAQAHLVVDHRLAVLEVPDPTVTKTIFQLPPNAQCHHCLNPQEMVLRVGGEQLR